MTISTKTRNQKAVRELKKLRTSDRSKKAASHHFCCRCCRCYW